MSSSKAGAVMSLPVFALVVSLTAAPPLARADELRQPSGTGILIAQAALVYKPPLRGSPGGRVGGGTRGTARETFVLSVLAPNHTGLTVSEQPMLYWFISAASPYPVELTVVDPRVTDPVLEIRLAPPIERGVHRIRLADHGIRLAIGVTYQWYVALVPDAARRSKDILAGGTIERVEPAAELTTKVAQAPKMELPFIYAEAGIWYDAFAALAGLIERSPDDAALRAQRTGLLKQVGLPEVNASD